MTTIGPYDHARVESKRRVMRWMIEPIFWRFLARIRSVEGLENVPSSGPAVIAYNHISLIDPLVVLGTLPRNTVPLAKVEAYRYPVIGIFPWLWEVIPVHRGEVDRTAVIKALRVLEAGETILVAPEGTRSPALQQGKEGAALLAVRTGALFVPVGIDGTDRFPTFSLRRWREEGVTIRIGRPFRFRSTGAKADRAELRRMTDEAMYELARLLPERRRGVYQDLSKATTSTLVFA